MDLTPPPFLANEGNCSDHAQRVVEQMSAVLSDCDAPIDDAGSLADSFQALLNSPFNELPVPARGASLARFAALSMVAARSLPLVKLYEAHTDALAILRELDAPLDLSQGRFGVFAAEAQAPELLAVPIDRQRVVLNGIKRWCSGAAIVDHALVTARGADDEALLIAVELSGAGVSVDANAWSAVGMALTSTSTLTFNNAPGTIVARNNRYIERPGFWHGAIGVAACWYGAAAALAEQLRQSLQQHSDAHALAHLGACATALHAARSALEVAAMRMDQEPRRDARALALATRAAVEASANQIMSHVGRALGARPFCFDAEFAHRAADLPVYLRQSHAERDLAALGHATLSIEPSWTSLYQSL